MTPELAHPHLCANCLNPAEKRRACQACGWDDEHDQEVQLHLPRHIVILSRYYVGRVLGHGGFGVTYLGRDMNLDRKVAIKEYFPAQQCARLSDRLTVRAIGSDPDNQFGYGLQKFLEEARALARFEGHPCIVPVTDFARANGTAYLVMPYMDGTTLKQYLTKQGGRIPYETALKIMMPVMDGLREVHAQSMLHRDVSPDNIFLSKDGRVKLLDFGAARHAMGEQSQSLSVILKPGFAPEEQYRSKGKQGPWTDVYAVATTLYACITGQVPPSAPDRLVEDELVAPSRLGVGLPSGAEAALMKALAVSAGNRWQTVEEFQAALMVVGKEVNVSEVRDMARSDSGKNSPGDRISGFEMWAIVIFFAIIISTLAIVLFH